MANWSLVFNHPRSIALEACEALMASFVEGKPAVALGELEGNPRDFYTRSVTITGQRGDLRVRLAGAQGLRGADEPEPILSSVSIELAEPADTPVPFATKLALWRELQTAFAAIGCHEDTLALQGAPIVDDADAAGDTETAALLRRQITDALIAQARISASVYIASPRVAIEPILAAYPRPADRITVSLVDCGLTALPANFGLFPKIETLTLQEDAFDGSILRGVSLPQLRELTLRGKSLARVTRADLAGFPALEILRLVDSPLEDLDPEILTVCPDLVRVYVEDTPLAANAPKMATLRARWPGMKWSYYDASTRARPKDRAAPTVDAPPPPPPVVVATTPPLQKQACDPTLQPFFAAILAAPDDDAPRLTLAALLTERGDPRGEQIRLACDFAKRERSDPDYETLSRCVVMPQFSFFSDTSYPFLQRQTARRGFVEEIVCTPRDFVTHADALLSDAPIRDFIADGCDGAAELAACPALAKLRSLTLRWDFLPEERSLVLASPHLRQTLQTLSVFSRFGTSADIERLAAELRPLTALRTLALCGTLAEPAVERLIELIEARHLAELDVELCTLQPSRLVETLWQRLGDARVRPRRVPLVPFRDGVLDLGSPMFSIEQLRALAATGMYRGAVRINLYHTRVGDAFVKLIASGRSFPLLAELNVAGSAITDRGVRALATEAIELDRLATIHLGGPDHTGDPVGVSDEAVVALAHSDRLPAMRTITRSIEHHCYSDGARDDTEVVAITRADGRVVESKIYHSIWP